MTTQVLIVGAGPTGLMAANQLNRFGIDFIIIDSKSGPTVESRAIAVTARSLEIYQQLGLSKTVVENGIKMNSFNLFSEGHPKAEIKIGEIGKGMTDFPYLLAYEQSDNESLLYENLKKDRKNVQWKTEFVSLKEDETGIIVLAKKNNEIFEIKAEYLIGCDGAKSLIRHQLNFNFHGGTYENKFFVADVIMNWKLPHNNLVIAPSDTNFVGFFPLKGDRYFRVLGTLPRAYFNKKNINFKDIEKEVIKTIGIPIDFEKMNWFSIYNLHHRCVDNFSSGRVHLAGDSAHIHSPAGGQGMNTGLQDAYNIAWKLAFVLNKQAKTDLLNTYNEERLPFAQWLMRFTDRMFNIMTNDNWFAAKFRKYVVVNLVGKVFTFEKIRPILFRRVSQIWYHYNGKSLSFSSSKQKLLFYAGDRLPYISDAHLTAPFYELFTEPTFHLLHLSNELLKPEMNENIKETFPFPIKIIEYPLTESWKKLGVNKELFVLVRPDNYIAYLSDFFLEAEIENYLSRYFYSNSKI
ncbi:2-polyprenyl-6-methoxyphenol hydroxylase [Flavobacterium swingsii]|uniref:2-polyprenyl-6-methoxyphenol hydroxylase n=1 Tax=Flavobacterium swingsii TaxID=498292 RepID=A0A1I0V2D6_9FLAO|nr:FAD-dependent monooxygenase [Flavobacterium swingsii]SFA69716.1 2-polyprenyl-6-methoxyphenol hydroxylase [Flavobacterium swingsii]